jgi:hypothetical protein
MTCDPVQNWLLIIIKNNGGKVLKNYKQFLPCLSTLWVAIFSLNLLIEQQLFILFCR